MARATARDEPGVGSEAGIEVPEAFAQSSRPIASREAGGLKRPQRLKICIVVPAHWEAVMGGSQYQAKMLVSHLAAARAHDIHYLARRVPGACATNGYEIRRIATPTGIRRYGELFDTWHLLAVLEELSPDVIYQRVGCAYTGVAAYYARKHRKRCVWHVACDQDVMPFDRGVSRNIAVRYLDKRMLEYGVRHADAIVTQTREQAELLWRHYRRRAAATIPNYHPLPTAEIEKRAGVKVAWIANVKPLKQPEVFLRLAKDLAALDGVEFIMIGKLMGKPSWCRRIADEAARLPNVRFMGEQPQEAVNGVLAGAHLLVNTSAYEGFPNTFIQAWLHQVPVLSLLVNPDGVFRDRRLGVCAGSYESLKGSLVELTGNRELREAMGARARKHAEVHHANPGNLAKLAAILTAGAGAGPAEPPQSERHPEE